MLLGHLIRDVGKLFTALDGDGNGAASGNEIANGLKRLDIAVCSDDVLRFVNSLDRNRNGLVGRMLAALALAWHHWKRLAMLSSSPDDTFQDGVVQTWTPWQPRSAGELVTVQGRVNPPELALVASQEERRLETW